MPHRIGHIRIYVYADILKVAECKKRNLEFTDRIILYLNSLFGKQTQSDKRIKFYGTDPLN